MVVVTSILMVLGSFFMLLGALAIVRYPDVLMRMQGATKASTLGVGALAIAVATHFDRTDITVRSLVVILFVFATAPAGAHAIARAAHNAKVSLWKKTSVDELAEAKERSGQA